MMKTLKTTNCWICNNTYIHGDVKVRDHCHITGKCGDSAHRDCNINVKLNQKISIKFHNLKTNDLHLSIQKLGKFNFEINLVPEP